MNARSAEPIKCPTPNAAEQVRLPPNGGRRAALRQFGVALAVACTLPAKLFAHDGAHVESDEPPTSSRLQRIYRMPAQPLVDQFDRPFEPARELEVPGPVLMTFIFTTCPGICPILSAVVAETSRLLGADLPMLRRWSLSIDPEHDRPQQLRDYAGSFDASAEWRWLTGTRFAVDEIRKAFDADSDNKMAHQALYLLRRDESNWERFEGAVTPAVLAGAVRASLRRH